MMIRRAAERAGTFRASSRKTRIETLMCGIPPYRVGTIFQSVIQKNKD